MLVGPMDPEIQRRLLILPLMIMSLTVHEFAHAWAAFRLGDDTAARQGRLTLNPIEHIDVMGTLILPIMGVPLGWAKPVPTNPVRYTRKLSMRTGQAIVASAGPLANLLLAVISAVLLALVYRHWIATGFTADLGHRDPHVVAQAALELLILINVGLAVFNLLPLPPLDGHYLVEATVKGRLQRPWESFKPYAPYLLLLILLVPQVRAFVLAPAEHALREQLYKIVRALL
jgi:Zn-dependent protease